MNKEKEGQNKLENVKKPKKIWLVLVIIVLALAAVASGLYLWNQKKTSQKDEKKTELETKNTDEDKASEEKIDIEDAKKYTNQVSDFTVYYPKDWFSEDEWNKSELDNVKSRIADGTGFYYFYADNLRPDQSAERTYFSISFSFGRDQDYYDLNSFISNGYEGYDNFEKTSSSYLGKNGYKIISDEPGIGKSGYFEGYIFETTKRKYYREKKLIIEVLAHTKDKETYDKMSSQFSFIFDNFILDKGIYDVSTPMPKLSAMDETRKKDLWEVANALDLYYRDRGEYPLYSTYDNLVMKLEENGYLDYNVIKDPSWPNKRYRYGAMCATNVSYKSGTCYYRIDAQLDDLSQEMVKKDGGAFTDRYEVGTALGQFVSKVNNMAE